MSERPIYGFMHIALMNHWDDVVRRQIWKIRESGLFDATDKIFWGAVGSGELPLFDPLFMSKVEFAYRDPDLKAFEFPTLQLVENACKTENCVVWYIHTKGVSYYPPKLDAEAWREYMEYFVIDHWKECLFAIETGADASGTLWNPGCRHFAGNFWWASAAHIRKLVPVKNLDQKNRMNAETWVGTLAKKGVRAIHDLWPFSRDYGIPRSDYPQKERFNVKSWRG